MKRYVVMAATLVGVALLAWWGIGSYNTQQSTSRLAIADGDKAPIPHLATSAPEALAVHPGPAPTPSNGTAVRLLYSADSIYASLVRLHGEKTPGSWGTMHQLIVACASADLSISAARSDLSNPAVIASPQYAARAEALRKLEYKCERPPTASYVSQFQPRDDDEEGRKFRAAANAVRDRKPGYRFADIEPAVRELARQGRLDVAVRDLPVDPHFAGRDWSNSDESFSAAVNAAIELATAETGREREDIRLLERCARFARCDFSYGALDDSVPPKYRDATRLLASELAQAIRTGDVDKLFGLKGR